MLCRRGAVVRGGGHARALCGVVEPRSALRCYYVVRVVGTKTEVAVLSSSSAFFFIPLVHVNRQPDNSAHWHDRCWQLVSHSILHLILHLRRSFFFFYSVSLHRQRLSHALNQSGPPLRNSLHDIQSAAGRAAAAVRSPQGAPSHANQQPRATSMYPIRSTCILTCRYSRRSWRAVALFGPFQPACVSPRHLARHERPLLRGCRCPQAGRLAAAVVVTLRDSPLRAEGEGAAVAALVAAIPLRRPQGIDFTVQRCLAAAPG